MSYYYVLKDINELTGERGFLKLPEYVFDAFIMDDERRRIIENVKSDLLSGRSVLLTGYSGSGKTALMAYILYSLISEGHNVGVILEGISSVGKEHEEEGVIIFYDDLPKARAELISSIFRYKPKSLLVTSRIEEIDILRKFGNIEDTFRIYEVRSMSKADLIKMAYSYAEREMIRIEEKEAVEFIAERANGLPIFVWQVIRDLRINKKNLNMQNVKEIPKGMLDYVDRILWRALRLKRERFPVLILLLLMTDVYKNSMHIDVFNMAYVVIKERLERRYLSSEEALFSELLDRITRYLYKNEQDYAYALPHDAWVDVLRGRSSGPISADISRINTAYPKKRRWNILIEAVLRAKNTTNRLKELEKFIELNKIEFTTL